MAPSGESFRNTFFFLRMVHAFYRWFLQNTTNHVMGIRADHDRSRYAAYSVKRDLRKAEDEEKWREKANIRDQWKQITKVAVLHSDQ